MNIEAGAVWLIAAGIHACTAVVLWRGEDRLMARMFIIIAALNVLIGATYLMGK